jgi:hypothetical protein
VKVADNYFLVREDGFEEPQGSEEQGSQVRALRAARGLGTQRGGWGTSGYIHLEVNEGNGVNADRKDNGRP